MAFGKRKRVYAPRRNVRKKRRSGVNNRRRRRSGFKRDRAFTSTSGATRDLRINLRKGSKRAWRSQLYRYSNMLTHYKTNLAGTFGLTTPASLINNRWGMFEVFANASPFWTSGGGLDTQSFGNAVPTFNSNHIIIRGGMCTSSIAVPPGNTGNMRVRIQLCYGKQQMVQAGSVTVRTNVPIIDYLAVLGSSMPIDKAAQSFADWEEYFFSPILDKEFILEPGHSARVEHKIKTRRIDVDQWQRGLGAYPFWLIYINNQTSATAEGVTIVNNYSLSFSVMPT